MRVRRKSVSIFCVPILLLIGCEAAPRSPLSLELTTSSADIVGEIDLTRYSLGQGGLSPRPMIDEHVEQVAQLHPQTIRLFVQEYFKLYPRPGRYHWNTLDKAIEAILATGAKPIMSLTFKPKVLYPKIDHQIVHPSDYNRWEELIYQLVKHCNQDRGYGVEYWEVGNEVDIGESGGCPYKFKPQDYLIYYTHTVNAILRADPSVKVGGPALARYESSIGDALIEHCGKGEAPLHFLSWHMYDNDPRNFRESIKEMKAKLAKYPSLKNVETILDEWNMSLSNPILNPYFQPAFILENTYGFYEERLTRGAYYHIRDFFVDAREFAEFMSESGTAFMAHWWNVMPQYDGLFNHHGRVRPAYHAFKLLSLIKGSELRLKGTDSDVKGFACTDGTWVNVILWSFPVERKEQVFDIVVRFPSSTQGRFRLVRLNPETQINHLEVLRFGKTSDLKNDPIRIKLNPYEIRWIEISQ